MKKNPVVHFELPAKDKERIKRFYEEVFGWEMNQLGEEFGNYILAMTTDVDEKQMPKVAGAINGGIYEKSADNESTRLTIQVDDINEAMKRIEEAGGKVIGGMQKPGEPDDIPGVGLYISFEDSEGNIETILQPHMKENI